jgi:hypothetical protein
MYKSSTRTGNIMSTTTASGISHRTPTSRTMTSPRQTSNNQPTSTRETRVENPSTLTTGVTSQQTSTSLITTPTSRPTSNNWPTTSPAASDSTLSSIDGVESTSVTGIAPIIPTGTGDEIPTERGVASSSYSPPPTPAVISLLALSAAILAICLFFFAAFVISKYRARNYEANRAGRAAGSVNSSSDRSSGRFLKFMRQIHSIDTIHLSRSPFPRHHNLKVSFVTYRFHLHLLLRCLPCLVLSSLFHWNR